MKKIFGLTTGLFLVTGLTCVSAFADTLTMQDFEDGTLAEWIIGGRQTGGSTNLWGVSEYAGSQMGYLYHRGFSELVLSKLFPYSPNMTLSFDAEFSIDGDTSPTPSGSVWSPSYNVMYQVDLRDSSGKLLGARRYVAESTYWYTDNFNELNIIDSVFFPDGLEHYEYDITDFALGLGIDTNNINDVCLSFIGYSPYVPKGPTMIIPAAPALTGTMF